MYVRIRILGQPETVVAIESKLTKIEDLRYILHDKFDLAPDVQRLFYGGKLLEDGYSFYDYNIKLNDVIQVMQNIQVNEKSQDNNQNNSVKKYNREVKYKDAESKLYAVGDFVDIRNTEYGSWHEGQIVGIVTRYTEDCAVNDKIEKNLNNVESNDRSWKYNDIEMEDLLLKSDNDSGDKPLNGDNLNFQMDDAGSLGVQIDTTDKMDENLLYKVQYDGDTEETDLYYKASEIRPRARTVIHVNDLNVGQTVMLNYNSEDSTEVGYWYDFKIAAINKQTVNCTLIGTIYSGPNASPQDDINVCVREKIYAIEEVVPLNQRTVEYKEMMMTTPEKRSVPVICLACRDADDVECGVCGCHICFGKQFPEKIILCDECNFGYHIGCLSPPLVAIPEDDWYCSDCKRDPNEVIAPGASKQIKKSSTTSNRDWGRGMACVGKSKTCLMPANHFGPIPGIDVGMCWRFRIQLSESGVHRPPVSGIHGRDLEGAYSIVLSGGYEDDVDYGYEFTYTGSGGRDLSGNKRTAGQSSDQKLVRENRALARNCAVNKIDEEGADAGINWREGKPVRVVRSYKMLKHFPKFAPEEGIRYDGIYKVVKYYPEEGLSGFRVWKYLLRRDDPSPAPWEPGAAQFSIIYPDGYLEAEAEKKALKKNTDKGTNSTLSRKRTLASHSKQSSEIELDNENSSPPIKKFKAIKQKKKKEKKPKKLICPKYQRPISDFFSKTLPKLSRKSVLGILNDEELAVIRADSVNIKPWEECLEICKMQGKPAFVEHVAQVFICIICQEVAALPVTTPCLHNFCMACIRNAFKSTSTMFCPCCRRNLSRYNLDYNEELQTALHLILPGYDVGRNPSKY